MRPHVAIALLLTVCSYVPGYGQAGSDTANGGSRKDTVTAMNEYGWLSVRSNPVGAEVYEGPRFLGVTPLDSVSSSAGIHVLRLFYPSVRFWNSASAIDTVAVVRAQVKASLVEFGVSLRHGMFRTERAYTETDPKLFLSQSDADRTRSWTGYAAGATMVLSGALSAYLKTNSDNYFDTYLTNRDPNLLTKVRRLDRWAGVSLFISEISFGVVTYLLLLE